MESVLCRRFYVESDFEVKVLMLAPVDQKMEKTKKNEQFRGQKLCKTFSAPLYAVNAEPPLGAGASRLASA